MSYESQYFCSFQSNPLFANLLWKKVDLRRRQSLQNVDPSQLANEWVVGSFINEVRRIDDGIELITLTELSAGGEGKEKTRLQAAMRAIQPLFLEYRAALLEIDSILKSPADIRALKLFKYKATWLMRRVTDAFDKIISLPIKDMAEAALAFKPTCTETFASELDQHGYALQLINPDVLEPWMCRRAVAQAPGALYCVPGAMRTRELCETAISDRRNSVAVLAFVPEAMRDHEMCKSAVLANGMNLEFVPKELRTVEICSLACLQQGLAWSFVPLEARNHEVEYCVALHGFADRSCSEIFQEFEGLDAPNAKAIDDRYTRLFVEMHYPQASVEDLADLGFPGEFAKSKTLLHPSVRQADKPKTSRPKMR